MSRVTDFIRTEFTKGDDIRDAGLTTPEGVERFDDIVYGKDSKWQILDVYRPKDKKGEKLPVIISFHGGGWSYGDKERYQYYCMSLAERGFAVINFTYRLNPEFQFPAPLSDCNSVCTWAFEHADEYGLDMDNLFGVGDSAGGHGLALYAAIATNPEYAALYDFKVPQKLKFRGVALNCGCYQISYGDGFSGSGQMELEIMQTYLPNGGTPWELWMINVMAHITAEFPPTFLMTCTGDFLKSEAQLLSRKLAEVEVPFVYRFYGDKDHELGHVFHCNVRSKEAALCNDEECSFFRGLCVNPQE